MKLRSKKGQLPFVELNGEEIADSAIIIKELSNKFEKDLDASLTAEQRNISHAMISMIENHLVWILFYWRTKNPDQLLKGYKVNLQNALGVRIPNGILNFFFRFTYGRKVSVGTMSFCFFIPITYICVCGFIIVYLYCFMGLLFKLVHWVFIGFLILLSIMLLASNF